MSGAGDREEVVERVQCALHALSEPASGFPGEHAVTYTRSLALLLDNFGADFTPDQVEALRRVDALLEDMADPETPELWMEGAARDHPAWQTVRVEVRATLAALAWQS